MTTYDELQEAWKRELHSLELQLLRSGLFKDLSSYIKRLIEAQKNLDETRSPSGPRTVSFKAKEWGFCLDTVRKRRSIDHRSRLEGARSISQGGRCEVAARKR